MTSSGWPCGSTRSGALGSNSRRWEWHTAQCSCIRGTSMLTPPGSGRWQSPQPSPSWFRSWRACWSTRQPCSVSGGTFLSCSRSVTPATSQVRVRWIAWENSRLERSSGKPAAPSATRCTLPLPGSVTTVGRNWGCALPKSAASRSVGLRRLPRSDRDGSPRTGSAYGDDPGRALVLAVAAGAGSRRRSPRR